MTSPGRSGRTAVVTALLLAAAGVSPPPVRADGPGSSPPGATTNLDEWLAYVAGEQVTRRMLVRQIGERAEGQSEGEYEARLRDVLLKRVLTGAMVWKARLFGLEAKPDVVDEEVAEAAKAEEKEARDRGTPIPFSEILRRRGQSLEEFKDLLARELLVRNYWVILMRGVPGKRAQVDVEPGPDETLRLYRDHRAAFDQQPGARLVSFSARPERFLEEVGGTYDAAIEAARRFVERLGREVAAGKSPEAVAAANQLEKGDWAATPEGRFVEKGAIPLVAADAWAFDPARRRGDVNVFDAPRGAIAAFVVLDVRPARTRAYDEVRTEIMDRIRATRSARFRLAHMLEVLAVAPVKPPVLVEEIAEQLRRALKRLDEDPVDREIRLR
ncbi:MAG: hypothetical protein IT460_08490 [Planctomycetes bacterium]|nr:hypothetical protein [Planctomycetota bacterium]